MFEFPNVLTPSQEELLKQLSSNKETPISKEALDILRKQFIKENFGENDPGEVIVEKLANAVAKQFYKTNPSKKSGVVELVLSVVYDTEKDEILDKDFEDVESSSLYKFEPETPGAKEQRFRASNTGKVTIFYANGKQEILENMPQTLNSFVRKQKATDKVVSRSIAEEWLAEKGISAIKFEKQPGIWKKIA